uniref:Integrator complex subunit 8 n=1 Tax=Pavo cristatus TaxID=9049 RepID=A0A8C9EI70_PAVCR
MSAEAADREAATSSRPCTPPQTSWFEFLLEEDLLEQHLRKPSPDPPPVQLIVQFLEQASKPSVNEQNQVQPPPDNKRNRILKLLALKVAAHLKWDLDVLEKRYSLYCFILKLLNHRNSSVGRISLSRMNQMQQEKELTENILKVLKEQAADSILVLEGALKLNKDLYVHTIRTLDLLAMEPGMVNGETESSTAGLKISAEEIQCQVCYDLGAIYFQQGATNAALHENAKEKFFKTRELIAKVMSVLLLCKCSGRVFSADINLADQYSTFFVSVLQDLVKIFLEDNLALSLPVQFRQSVLRELFQKAQQGNDALDEVCFKICVCNTVCDVLQGQIIDIQFCQLFLKPTKEKIDFLLEVCSRSINLETASESLKRKMAAFLKNLCLGLEDLQLVFMISSHELFMKLLKDDERKLLVDQMRKRSLRINLSTKPVTSFYDIPASASVSIGQLEHQLILSVDPWRIRQILIELHGMTSERQFWTISNKWEVPNVYGNVILGIKDNLTRDLVYILMAKGLHCCAIKVSKPSQLAVSWFEQLKFNNNNNIEHIPLRQVIAEECVAFLLNWRENEYLTMQVPLPLVQTNPYVKLGQLLAATCKELPGPKESRRTAKDLWEVVVQICSVSNQHKRGNDGRVSLIKHRESTLGIMYRSELLSFIKKLREPLVLTTILSLFVKLHNVREDIVNDITAEYISIWPSSIPNLQSVDFEAVAVTVKELVNYALTINSNNHFWLIIQADIYFATNQYSAALHYYLQAGAVCSDFFNKMVPPDVFTDQVSYGCHICTSLEHLQGWCLPHLPGQPIKAIGQTELNASNPEEVLQLAAQRRKKKFLQAMAKLYF